MEYRNVGSSDLSVSHVCLGTMTWGEQNTEAEAHEQLDYAWDQGVNCMDTAEMYAVPTRPETQGSTERYVGSWLKTRRRDEVIIFGKVSGPSPQVWIPTGRTPPQPEAITRIDAASIRGAIEGSLQRLGTDYMDLVELHWPERYIGTLFGANAYVRSREQADVISFEAQVEALWQMQKEGKIRHWGLSNETTYGVCQFHEAARRMGGPLPVSIQNDFSLTDRTFETELAEACAPRHLDIGFLVYGALSGGTLTGKYHDGTDQRARHKLWPDFQPRYHAERTRQAAENYAAIAGRHGLTPTELALAWVYAREYVTSTIIGATTMDQLKACIAAKDVVLPQSALEEIEQEHLRCPNPNKGTISPRFIEDLRKGL
ncbi:MAG: aldo/keto reductase [Alphaproteobacteria bacterium]|jgi:aryl-alcohol dehydrogenase-like predicted oxidoreductase|nr:aldo/keto reductase [Rhodospirillaceae bacterium]MBT6509067.1 aldo/keto reductase [Rhodospirillaceae bacterium]MBT7614025.1 aldo/keto reductase [Rhodospirillaceae bacterium]MBT7649179.1 aldo/keto reductase [Rhodospirillaceae bacterium]MDG2479872.1 aldo/keto reductase [Alphaproteobacteria bacterium]